ncbi:radical SAM/SPASM domain-containing protein [Candidatus Margulisiibacteriota bacterium]
MNKIQVVKYLIRNRKITMKKAANLLACYWSYWTRSVKSRGGPLVLMIEPTNICNLSCPLCAAGNGSMKRKRGQLEYSRYKRLIDNVATDVLNVSLYGVGEPFLNKDLFRMIKYTNKKGIFTRVSTNGTALTSNNIKKLIDTGLDNLVISLDGATPLTYAKYRRAGDFANVVENIRSVVRLKKKNKIRSPMIELQYIIMKHNEAEIPGIKKIANEIGVDNLVLKTVNTRYGKQYQPSNTKYRRKIRAKQCNWLWFGSFVQWDGDVAVCCRVDDKQMVVGNACKEDIRVIWNNAEYIDQRKKYLNNNKHEICQGCTGNIVNK